MKKLTLLAALAVCGLGANAQYVGDPSLNATIGKGEIFDIFQLDATSVESLKAAGKTVNVYTLDNVERCFYVWDGTFTEGDSSYPGVDMQMDGYTSINVGTVGWSGAGFTIVDNNDLGVHSSIDLGHISDDTRFHMGLRSSNPASSIAVIFGDGTNKDTGVKWSPAKFSIGQAAFNDNGTIFPLIGDFDREGGDWVAIDIKFSDMKKLWPGFNYTAGKFFGNIYSVLGGSATGTNICIDAVYLYSPKNDSVEGIAADENQIVVSGKTVSVIGGEGIELYNISGQLVKKSNSSIMGVEDIDGGIYIVKAGNAVKKVVLK